MTFLRSFFLRLHHLFHKSEMERELSDELDAHLQLHIDDNLRAGLTPEEARRDALVNLGGIEQTKASVRDHRCFPLFESLARDVQFAARLLSWSVVAPTKSAFVWLSVLRVPQFSGSSSERVFHSSYSASPSACPSPSPPIVSSRPCCSACPPPLLSSSWPSESSSPPPYAATSRPAAPPALTL